MTCPKRSYGRKTAQREAQRLRDETGELFRCYPCPDCGQWHLTTATPSQEANRSRDKLRASRRGRRTEGMTLAEVEEMARGMRGGG